MKILEVPSILNLFLFKTKYLHLKCLILHPKSRLGNPVTNEFRYSNQSIIAAISPPPPLGLGLVLWAHLSCIIHNLLPGEVSAHVGLENSAMQS